MGQAETERDRRRSRDRELHAQGPQVQARAGRGRAYWQEFDVELDPTLSVLDGLLQAKDRDDGSLSVRCSCRAAICGSCGVTDQRPVHARLPDPDRRGPRGRQPAQLNGEPNPVVVEPMGNMPVIKDLVTDMESTHWAKIRRVTPWLLDDGDPPERERVVPPESMVDITQTIACIQCGACVSSCLSMEADPDFIGPAALAKAYRFVGDPRDVESRERLCDLAQDPHGIYDCTHCFACVDACPKGVAPMDQIMRLRRAAGHDEEIDDHNNGHNHEAAFVKIIEKKGTLDESLLLQESYAPGVKGKLMPKLGGDQGPDRLDPDRDPRHPRGQDALAAEADPRHPPQAARRRAGARQAHRRARRGAPRRAQPLHHGRGGRGAGAEGARRGARGRLDRRRAARRSRRR